MRSLFLFVALLVAPASVTAQDDATQARRHFDAGVAHFEAGEFRQALDQFRDAYRIRPHPAVLVNIANCYLEIDRPVDAAQHFERYLREAGDVDPEQRAEVERALGQARAAIATIDVTGGQGISVFVDGDSVGRIPLRRPIEVNPGPHIVELRAPDGALRQERVTLERGEARTIDAGAPPGTERPRSTEGGGTLPGPGPRPSTSPNIGPVGAPDAPLPPSDGEGTGVPVATWIAGGVSVVALGLGVTFGVIALSQQSEFEEIVRDIQSRPASDPAIPDLQAEGRAVADAQAANALVSDLFFITAIAAAGVAVLFYVTSGDEDGSVPSTVAGIAPLDRGAALTLSSTF